MAPERIAVRVRHGGQHVPEEDVRRRYHRSIGNLFGMYRPILDYWGIFNNSAGSPATIAYEEPAQLQIIDSKSYLALIDQSTSYEQT
jgi:predicted ABC-type ATPase